MWDGQFEFVGNAYDAGPAGVDVLKLPIISRNSHVFGVQKVISSHRCSFMTIFKIFFTITTYTYNNHSRAMFVYNVYIIGIYIIYFVIL